MRRAAWQAEIARRADAGDARAYWITVLGDKPRSELDRWRLGLTR